MQTEVNTEQPRSRGGFAFRVQLYFVVVFVLFSMLILRLATLQFVEGPKLREQFENASTSKVKIPPIRGDILDSEGNKIAYSTSTQSLYFTLERGFTKEEAQQLALKLQQIFIDYGDPSGAMTAKDIVKQMDLKFAQNTIAVPRRIKTGLTNQEIAYFAEHRDQFKGFEVIEEAVRNYASDPLAVQLVGYLKKYRGVKDVLDVYEAKRSEEDARLQYLDDEDVGYDGLELMYQDVLRGKNGLKIYPVNARDEIIGEPDITAPERGHNLVLTINSTVQRKTEQAIMNQLEKLRNTPASQHGAPYARTGYAVAMEVATGKIIAMASMPDYDPNVWKGGRISSEDMKRTQFFQGNGTIRQNYAPYESQEERDRHPPSLVFLGSTQKPLSILVGLNEGLFTTGTTIQDNGIFYFGRKGHEVSVRNASGAANGRIDPAKALAKSSNVFMSQMIGNELYKKYQRKGLDVWDSYMKQFGLGAPTGSGLPNEHNGIVGYYDKEAGSAQAALIYASFGQQGRYTTLQLAQYAATLASRGTRMKPQFVDRIVDGEGKVIQGFKPEVMNQVDFPEAYWDEVFQGMAQVKVQGFEDASYSFYRKTGTSQQDAGNRKKVENAVFIAFAPQKNPKLAVAVVVPDGGYGGYGAAPIARQIFDAYDEEIGLQNGTK
ncbi:peptidoglycan D,D-transpeptidase FtsI family protein [Paenibacillus aurantiacus]|uniref:Peptidoglycan D,D-transpeptidase FtsI family protein n=1 Tax=Paenibacillus aurantiacus TaxID=1936118 RepID=A0ABV5KV04_9BACL